MCRNDAKLATLTSFAPPYGVEFVLFAAMYAGMGKHLAEHGYMTSSVEMSTEALSRSPGFEREPTADSEL
jgi:hypothetical protein